MKAQLDITNNCYKPDQKIYDNYNSFIFDKDSSIFNKLYYKFKAYEMTKHLHGDIVECGVFKGSGLAAWLKLLSIYEPNSIKKVIGFDFFNPSFVDTLKDEQDKESMSQVFTRVNNLEFDDISYNGVFTKLVHAGFCSSKFGLVQGDISETSVEFVKNNPGFRISILYLDLDIDIPTYDALEAFWDRIVPGGMVVFDEYGYHAWSESNAADRFIKKYGLKLHDTKIKSPTGFIIK
jgi:hypothetical protein